VLIAVAAAGSLGAGAGCANRKSRLVAPKPTSSTAPPTTAATGVGLGPLVPAAPGGPGDSTNTTTVACQPVPAPSPSVEGPANGPSMPKGARWFDARTGQGGKVYAGALPETLDQLRDRAVHAWKDEGWVELAGESEPGREIEGVLRKGSTRIGIRARTIYCDKAWTELRISVTG
jgi:hypothetical protein